MVLPHPNEIKELLPYLTPHERAELEALLEAEVAESKAIMIPDPPDIVEWGEDRFYVIETKRPIVLQPVQMAVLREFFRRGDDGRFIYRTGLYSTIKKSGKTTIAALVMQWATETWGDYGEIYHMGNKLGQAKERGFKIAKHSIELSPWKRDWEITALSLRHLPTHSMIQPLPVNAAGEAGGNQRLTAWTEFHGYVYEENNRMWSELQPVPTQPLSFRFVESYAGYEGESMLLKGIWDRALTKGIRVHDDYPIYAIPEEGLIAYIDTGEEARRMPWQTPAYYQQASAEELPHEYQRLHRNEWVTSQAALINVALWDRLGEEQFEVAHPKKLDVVLAVDASVSGDCTALTATAYIPESSPGADDDKVIELETYVYEPPKGGKIDYHAELKPDIYQLWHKYRVIGIAYDEYQMHDFMTQLAKDPSLARAGRNSKEREAFFYPFPQGQERLKSDTALVRRIQQGKLQHSGNDLVRQHVQNADGKRVNESAIRIVKRVSSNPIDAIVAISMGAWRIYELMTHTPKSNSPRQVGHRGLYSSTSQRAPLRRR